MIQIQLRPTLPDLRFDDEDVVDLSPPASLRDSTGEVPEPMLRMSILSPRACTSLAWETLFASEAMLQKSSIICPGGLMSKGRISLRVCCCRYELRRRDELPSPPLRFCVLVALVSCCCCSCCSCSSRVRRRVLSSCSRCIWAASCSARTNAGCGRHW